MFERDKLKNGLRVIIAPMQSTKTVTLLAITGVGSKYESDRIAGLSHFLEHMFFKGTEKRPNARAISEYLDEIGGEYNAFTSKEFTGFYAKVISKYLDRAFDVISDILLDSKFATEKIERERGVIIEEMNMYQDTPMVYVSDLFENLLYGNQPAGRLVIGNKKSISSVKRSDFINYYKRFYTASNMAVCVAGNVSEKEAFNLVKKYFRGISAKKAGLKKKVVEKQSSPSVLLHHKDTDQTHICLGVRGYNILDDKKYPLSILSVILGGGMSSRLFMSVREKLGLAYYIRCESENYTDSGYICVHAGLDSTRIDKAIKVIVKELVRARDDGISSKELKKAKEYIKGKTLMGLEISDEYSSWLARQEILTSKLESVEEKFSKIDRVTASDVRRVANDVVVNNKLNLALIGPHKNKKRFVKLLKV
jgi:predicted Zn-dependent peptidase